MEKPAEPTLMLTHKDWEFDNHESMFDWVSSLLDSMEATGGDSHPPQKQASSSVDDALADRMRRRSRASRGSVGSVGGENRALRERILVLERQNKALESKIDQVLALLRGSK